MSVRPLEAVDGGRAPGGWEALWARDRWPLWELPHGDLHGTARDGSILFAGIAQPWLKEAAKRWARARLLAGGAPSTMAGNVHHVQTFSGWLLERAPEVSSPAGITRAVLEDWLLAVRASGLAAGTKATRVTAVRLFLAWIHESAGQPA
jgi:hypothetical protein